jgi:hypothetical protein
MNTVVDLGKASVVTRGHPNGPTELNPAPAAGLQQFG